jgi:signal transduction histidine kinase
MVGGARGGEVGDRGAETCALAPALAQRLRAAREDLTLRWLERITARASVDPDKVFPGETLLNHVPILIEGIADHLETAANTVAADTPVIAKAMELGALRYAQGFSEHELLKQYEILGGVTFDFLASTIRTIGTPCEPDEVFACAHRLFHAIAIIQQATLLQYLQLMRARLSEREERLRAFNRSLTHEFRNRIGAVIGAGEVLGLESLTTSERDRLIDIVVRNGAEMRILLENLLELSRLEIQGRQHRHVKLPRAVAEAVRQLRASAEAARVEIRVSPDLPDVEVHAAAIELCLTNLLSNAIKYSDPTKQVRWVEVRGRVDRPEPSRDQKLVLEVCDNGVGLAEAQRARLFERFYRGGRDETSSVAGTGLGLSIVKETIESIGGAVHVEFPPEGLVFALTFPLRRAADEEAAIGTR